MDHHGAIRGRLALMQIAFYVCNAALIFAVNPAMLVPLAVGEVLTALLMASLGCRTRNTPTACACYTCAPGQ